MNNLALIDGDIIAFEAACASEKSIQWEEGEEAQRVPDEAEAMKQLSIRIQTIKEYAKADRVVIALSCESRRYWRHDILPSYKSHRKAAVRPLMLDQCREKLRMDFGCVAKPGLEGDDILGILATSGAFRKKHKGGDIVIVTKDKDLNQIPGTHLRHDKLDEGLYHVTAAEGDHFHLMQTLTGDTCDGYKGCPGIGPVKAQALLDDAGTSPAARWKAIVAAYKVKDLTAADALVQARVARILRASEYDFENRKPILWRSNK